LFNGARKSANHPAGSMKIQSNPQRDRAWQELHTRPFVRFTAPAHVLHLAFLGGEETNEADDENRARLIEAMSLVATYESPKHSIHAVTLNELGRLVFCWERHSEYTAFTFFFYELKKKFQPFGFDFEKVLPPGWLQSLGGVPLVATQIAVGRRDEMPNTLDSLTTLFEGHTINGSQIMAGLGEAWTCYRTHGDGLGRIAVVVNTMSAQEIGRTVQRLVAIEDYYHLALLSAPLASEIQPELIAAEDLMVEEMDKLYKAASVEEKRAVLDTLLSLAAEVEHLRARIAKRFGGSIAYFSLLKARFDELREAKIDHVLPLDRFVMRRLVPAIDTCRSTHRRLISLSERINSAAELLRTSVELIVQEQNLRLLESANQKAHLQLRLQQSVEALSVVVISYYALGLLGHLLDGVESTGMGLNVKLALGIATPIVLAAVWIIVHRVRKQFR
jgi:uncharacterized membrane-anchored protein